MSSRRIVLGFIVALGLLAFAIPRSPGQNPNNPKGIDVSDYQGNINWTSVKNSGISFAFIKATEGTTFTATTFAANWMNSKAAGIVRGSYHFARPGTSPTVSGNAIAQANFFINTVKPQKGDLQLVCDFEDNSNALSQTDMGTWLTAFCNQIASVTHRPAIVYTYPSFWSNMPSNWTNPNCGLWIANYGVSSPSIPPPWGTSYAFWQYSSSGTSTNVSGIQIYPVDLDTYNGSMSSLLNFTYPRDPLNRR
jgi:GH25 family lysozyme M1 (1,4-beta-N-acetylmuramidase)